MSEGVQKMSKFNFFSNRSLSGVGRSRPGRGEVEGVKTDPGRARGGPEGTKNGPLWPKNGQNFSKIFGHHPGDPCHSAEYEGK